MKTITIKEAIKMVEEVPVIKATAKAAASIQGRDGGSLEDFPNRIRLTVQKAAMSALAEQIKRNLQGVDIGQGFVSFGKTPTIIIKADDDGLKKEATLYEEGECYDADELLRSSRLMANIITGKRWWL